MPQTFYNDTNTKINNKHIFLQFFNLQLKVLDFEFLSSSKCFGSSSLNVF